MTVAFVAGVGCGPPRLKASPNSSLPATVMTPKSSTEQDANRPLDPRIADMHVDGVHVFQDYLDPEVADSRPDDFTIYSGWTEFLVDDAIIDAGSSTTWHLCSNGMLINEGAGTGRDWRIARSLGTPDDEWGTVSVMVEITTGRWKGHEYAAVTLTRKDDGLFISNTSTPGFVEIERSDRCLVELA